jgi:hypothetical protein
MSLAYGPTRAVGISLVILFSGDGLSSGDGRRAQDAASGCQPVGGVVRVPALDEASGLAVSRLNPNRLWAHNDSGAPELVALRANGTVERRVRVSGASVDDWEAIAIGPCSAGSCIHVGDIGDNSAGRARITIYRTVEPAAGADTLVVTGVFHASYPDGAKDAETLLVRPDGEMYVVTKGDEAPAAIYRFPADVRSGATVRLEPVGAPRDPADGTEPITDGSVSADGAWVALRSTTSLSLHRADEFFAGNWRAVRRINLKPLNEPQGEGVALGANDVIYIVGESGGQARGGTFAALTCPAP